MARRTNDFQTIRSEGGLLPPDLLRRVLDPKEKLAGTLPEDYGLPQGERLNEVITQSWNRLRKHWAEFRTSAANLPKGEAGTGLTNDKWSLPLLRELGFGLLPTSASPEVGGHAYAISRFFGPVPVHLVGCGLSLDRRAAGVRGAAAANPHGLVQEFLNRSPGHIWAIVANGLRLRLLRDNQALSRQSFLEFDLESMFAGEVFSDFVLLWLTAHATRFVPREADRPETCWLEQWTKLAEEQGTRALGDLRDGVERALQALGEGFTIHPKNTALRDALRTGQVTPVNFHGQLLRVVYRLIFLFVAEDRTLDGQSLLYPRDDSEPARLARERYATHYSTARLRELASNIKGSRHGDLWQQFQILVGALSGNASCAATREQLALPALGSFLWDQDSTAALNDAELTNYDFLEALRHLAFTRQGKVLRPVDYKNLGAEELGGVYESLLALTPQISADGARFTFAEFAGNERKTSGSYYTPDSLVQCLLDSALDPVVEEAIKGRSGAEAEKAILTLKVCDPAVGSGHFLVGAAHRLARHLARVRALAQGESEPSPLLYQHALRDVIGRCLYGVDLNPMAAELCRVSLWLEALEPGKPLSFLDHHIRVGNSLLGATPELIAAGIPDDAFRPIEGDDRKACSALKKRNKGERAGLGPLFAEQDAETQARLLQAAAVLEELPDDRPDHIHAKEQAFHGFEEAVEYNLKKKIADAWCAAFVVRKYFPPSPRDPRFPSTEPSGMTTAHLIGMTAARQLSAELDAEIERLSDQNRFFHWHLAFPEAFARGGFDCVLGNPPWERVKLQEKEWFAERNPEIANATSAAVRKRSIEALEDADPDLYQQFAADSRKAEGESHFMRNSGRYPLCGRGDINVYAIFAEGMRNLLNDSGRVGCVLPTGIATDDTTKSFFQDVVERKSLASLIDFENKLLIFAAVAPVVKFCLFTSGRGVRPTVEAAEFVFFAHAVEDLRDPDRDFTLSAEDIALLNPNTRTCPIFRSRRDAELTKAIYRRVPVLIREAQGDKPEENPWGLAFNRMFDMSNDSQLFRTRERLEADGWRLEGNIFRNDSSEYLPLYEAKLFHQFNHRPSTFDGIAEAERFKMKAPTKPSSREQLENPFYAALPRFWVSRRDVDAACQAFSTVRWFVAFRGMTNVMTNSRNAVFAVLPRIAVGNSAPVCVFAGTERAFAFLSAVDSLVFDYATRQKLAGGNMNFFIVNQLPVLLPDDYELPCRWSTNSLILHDWLLPRTLELTYTAWDVEAFAQDCGWYGPPFRWDEERRFLLRCELDAAFLQLYLPAEANGDWRRAEGETEEDLARLKTSFPTPRDAVVHIMGTFPIVQRKDEGKWGVYRTKDTILQIYDEMADVIAENAAAEAAKRQPVAQYQTRLNPLPGPPMDADGSFISMAQLDRANWPSHIHLPREETVERPAEIPLEEFAAMAYPATDVERAICAAALAIVAQSPGLSSADHLDALLLATHPDWCKVFLDQGDHRALGAARRSAPDSLYVGEDQPIRWKECRDYLEQRHAIAINRRGQGQAISAGADLTSVQTSLPSGVDEIVRLALNAMERVSDLRKDLSSVLEEQARIIRVFEEQHKLYQLVA